MSTHRLDRPSGPVDLFRDLWRQQQPLMVFSVVMALFSLLLVVGVMADGRMIGGQPAWMKPLKFALSMVIYTITIIWLLGFVRSQRRWIQRGVRAFGWLVIVVFVVEMVVIAGQAARGVTSHFNAATPLDTALYSVMGTAITVLWVANGVLAVILLFQRIEPPAMAWGLRLGLILAVVGMGQAFLMTSPTARQMAGWQLGEPITVVGAHSVGASDADGPGLPMLGWRTDVGDLRVGHFVGMHGLQALPFLAWFLGRRRRLGEGQRTGLVWTGAAAYLALVILLTVQALRAQPLIRPDVLTLGALALIVAGTAVAALLILRRPGAEANTAEAST